MKGPLALPSGKGPARPGGGSFANVTGQRSPSPRNGAEVGRVALV